MKTALLVVDPQQIYTDNDSELYCADADETIKRINSLLEHARSSEQLIILI